MDQSNDTLPTILESIMDPVTSEAIQYGSSYTVKKAMDYIWDMMDSVEDNEYNALVNKINSPEFVVGLIDKFGKNPGFYDMLATASIRFNEPWKNEDVITTRELLKVLAGKKQIRIKRKDNELYCRLKAVDEYSSGIRLKGMPETVWKNATISNNEPIGYDAIRSLIDDDREKAEHYATTLDAKLRFEEYRKKMALQRQKEAEERSKEPKPELRIYREKLEDPSSDEYWDDNREDTEEEPDYTILNSGIPISFLVAQRILENWPIDPVTGLKEGLL